MKNKPLEMCLLFDFYGEMLTDKQKEVFDLYYNEDLSLAEISEHIGITRQGVRDSIVRAEHTLRDMEQRLGLVARYGKIDPLIDSMLGDVHRLRIINSNQLHNPEISRTLARLDENLKAIASGRTL
ncbi:YlxM family DNA-binding protein [Intestinibacillus sp. Marseille-P6563]|uniref:YlxM family DNA-binding protein n=1 Tax=Intestinibacillus sp. Marseille-P6563 TaxID=2364792 RepID=UPI000F06D981|nr:YlxM family DNA-binding protein [Intestinibacillus sp. Marseille-P6563]